MRDYFCKYKKYIMYLFVCLLFIVLIPILLEFIIFRNNFYSPVSNEGWASFFGSFFGGIIGGIMTLLGVILTIDFTQKNIQREKKELYFNDRPILIYKKEHEYYRSSNKCYASLEEIQINRFFLCGITLRNAGKRPVKFLKIYINNQLEERIINTPILPNEDYYLENIKYKFSDENKKRILGKENYCKIMLEFYDFEGNVFNTEIDCDIYTNTVNQVIYYYISNINYLLNSEPSKKNKS